MSETHHPQRLLPEGLPDTALVRQSWSLVTAALPLPVLHHSARTFLLGQAHAAKAQRPFDDEGLCLAALFHDVGLVAADRPRAVPFTRHSSATMRRFLLDQAVPEERITPLAEAIELHMQLFPRFDRGPIAGLLQIGAWMDIAFRGRFRHRGEARRIEALLPRYNVDFEFPKLLLKTFTSPEACLGLLFVPTPDLPGAAAR